MKNSEHSKNSMAETTATNKICGICGKTKSKWVLSEDCNHKLCVSCLCDSVKSLNRLPFPCPVQKCRALFTLTFLEKSLKEVFPKDEFEKLTKKLKICSYCFEVSMLKKEMKKMKCEHNCCPECADENNNKCLECAKPAFLKSVDEDKPTFDTGDKKRTCKKCLEKSTETEKMACCNNRICQNCLKKQLEKNLAKSEEDNNRTMSCLICSAKLQQEIIFSVLNDDKYKNYRRLTERRKCEVCFLGRKKNDMIKFDDNQHRICKNCLKKYYETIGEGNKLPKRIPCIVNDCKNTVNINELQKTLEKAFTKKNNKIEENENEKQEDEIQEEYKQERIEEEHNDDQDGQDKNKDEIKSIKPEKKSGIICRICFYEIKNWEMMTLPCNHKFCKSCISQHCDSKIGVGLINDSSLICPEEGCQTPINYFIIKAVVSKNNFEKYDSLLLRHSLENKKENKVESIEKSPIIINDFRSEENKSNKKSDEKMISCPKCENYYFINSSSQYFTCGKCNEKYCADEKCLKKWSEHYGKNCEELIKSTNKNDKNLDEIEFEEYIKTNNLQKCPVCYAVVEKSRNCNYVQCASIRCQKKTTFCYICGEQLQQKDLANHYINGSAYSGCKKRTTNENQTR